MSSQTREWGGQDELILIMFRASNPTYKKTCRTSFTNRSQLKVAIKTTVSSGNPNEITYKLCRLKTLLANSQGGWYAYFIAA
jgi:hypothetical protein